MAVKPANSNYHTFTFNGVRAADYGIYVTDVNVFNSAARDVEYIQIPGRDGAFALDRGRFQNISVVYKCAMTQDTDEDFATAISEFRNAIASTKGYKRLEDDIHTDEYRMGVFSKGLEAPTLNTKTATFDVEFNCQPQRFLKSGETAVTIGGDVTNTKTETGSIVSIESDGGDAVTSLVAQIDPVQAGSGDPSPTNVRAITGWTAANLFDTGKNIVDESTATGYNAAVTVDGGYISVTKNGSSNYPAAHINTYLRAGVTYTVSATCVQATTQTRLAIRDVAPSNTTVTDSASYSEDGQRKSVTYTPTKSGMYRVALFSSFGTADTSTAIFTDVQCEIGSTATAYEPYTGTTTTTALGRTVYGGTVDVVTGTLTLTHKAEIFNGSEAWGSEQKSGGLTNYYLNLDNNGKMAGRQGGLLDDELLCNWLAPSSSITTYSVYVGTSSKYLNCKCQSASDVAAFKSMLSATPLVVVYPLATPQTYTLTAQQVELLAGNNTVWTDTGDTTLTYGRDPNKIVNPTLFESHPLLHLWGYGSIGINGDQLSINNDQYGKILLVDKTKHETRGLSKYIYRNSDHPNPKVSLMNEGDTLTLVRGSFISIQLYGLPVVRFTNVSVSVGGGISASVPSGATQIKNVSLTFPEYTFSFGTTKTETIPITITAAYTYEGAQRTATVTGDIRVVYNVGSFYQSVSITILNITNTGSADFSVSTNPDKNGTLQAIYGYSTKRPFADDADFYFDLDIGEAYKIEDGQTVSVNNAVTIPAQLPVLKSGSNTITYDDTVDQFRIVPRWWEV